MILGLGRYELLEVVECQGVSHNDVQVKNAQLVSDPLVSPNLNLCPVLKGVQSVKSCG